jgi:hypothetical protein
MPVMTRPANHAECRTYLRDGMAQRGIDITVSTEPPIIKTPYVADPFTCPHGTRYWIEPTSEQRAQWAKDGVQ